jgi:hypothetical protein
MESLGARVLSHADGGSMRGWGEPTWVVELGVRGMRIGASMDMLDDTSDMGALVQLWKGQL